MLVDINCDAAASWVPRGHILIFEYGKSLQRPQFWIIERKIAEPCAANPAPDIPRQLNLLIPSSHQLL